MNPVPPRTSRFSEEPDRCAPNRAAACASAGVTRPSSAPPRTVPAFRKSRRVVIVGTVEEQILPSPMLGAELAVNYPPDEILTRTRLPCPDHHQPTVTVGHLTRVFARNRRRAGIHLDAIHVLERDVVRGVAPFHHSPIEPHAHDARSALPAATTGVDDLVPPRRREEPHTHAVDDTYARRPP